jgi:hypothetical protein
MRVSDICHQLGGGKVIGNLDPLHAMPFRRVQRRSLRFRKSHIARLVVHARSLETA